MALVNERVRILENECVGPNLYLMTLSSPAIAAAIEPGQFVHMKIPGMEGHVLRRPFSVYAADAAGGTLDVLYQTVGFGTNHLAALAPDVAHEIDSAELIGPVGRRWQAPAGTQQSALCIAPFFQKGLAIGEHMCYTIDAEARSCFSKNSIWLVERCANACSSTIFIFRRFFYGTKTACSRKRRV